MISQLMVAAFKWKTRMTFLVPSFGDEWLLLSVQSSGDFYNDVFGSTVASGVNLLVLGSLGSVCD
tara:strand:- start:437 stop:631 length:195 start_codon:yes stop_codon:yes gene_type:complete